METFVFRYEKILKLREDEEEQCRNMLALRIRERHELEQGLAELEARQAVFHNEAAERVAAGCTVQELRIAEAQRKWLTEAIENQRFLIELKESDVTAARIKLGEASKRKKIMEKLRENDYIQFQKEAELAEELATDQIVTFSSSQKRNQ